VKTVNGGGKGGKERRGVKTVKWGGLSLAYSISKIVFHRKKKEGGGRRKKKKKEGGGKGGLQNTKTTLNFYCPVRHLLADPLERKKGKGKGGKGEVGTAFYARLSLFPSIGKVKKKRKRGGKRGKEGGKKRRSNHTGQYKKGAFLSLKTALDETIHITREKKGGGRGKKRGRGGVGGKGDFLDICRHRGKGKGGKKKRKKGGKWIINWRPSTSVPNSAT